MRANWPLGAKRTGLTINAGGRMILHQRFIASTSTGWSAGLQTIVTSAPTGDRWRQPGAAGM